MPADPKGEKRPTELRSRRKDGPKAAVDAALEVWLSSLALRQVAWLTGLA